MPYPLAVGLVYKCSKFRKSKGRSLLRAQPGNRRQIRLSGHAFCGEILKVVNSSYHVTLDSASWEGVGERARRVRTSPFLPLVLYDVPMMGDFRYVWQAAN